jgi:Uncharacterized protein conserved in bacteria (DUF2059)
MTKSNKAWFGPFVKLVAGGALILHGLPAFSMNLSEDSAQIGPENSIAHFQVALELAKTLKSEATIQGEARYAFDGRLAKDLQADPDVASLEAEYPGVTQHMLLAMQSEIEALTAKSIPDLWDRLAKIFASGMTEAELIQALAFYSSPTGKRLIAATHANTDYARLGKAVVEDPESKVSVKDLKAAVRAGVGKTVDGMSEDDTATLMAFSKTAAYLRVRELGPKVIETAAEWSNESSAEDEQRMEEIASKAIEEFIDKADSANSGDQK